MKNPTVETALKKICSELGANVTDPTCVRGRLSDYAAGQHGATNVLMTAHQFGVVQAFSGSIQNDKAELQIKAEKFLRDELIENAHLAEDAAVWALNTWFAALNVPYRALHKEVKNKATKAAASRQPQPAPMHGVTTHGTSSPKSLLVSMAGTICLLLFSAAILLFIYLDPLDKASIKKTSEGTFAKEKGAQATPSSESTQPAKATK